MSTSKKSASKRPEKRGAALTIPANPLFDGLVSELRDQLGDDMELVRLTIVAEGRAAR